MSACNGSFFLILSYLIHSNIIWVSDTEVVLNDIINWLAQYGICLLEEDPDIASKDEHDNKKAPCACHKILIWLTALKH